MNLLISLFRPAPQHEEAITDPNKLDKSYRYWRRRILYSTLIGYALFYVVRKNISLAMPAMEADLGISKAVLGMFLTLHGVLYGVSKFANGFLGDRSNPRYFMSLGLLCSAAMSVCFGSSNTVLTFGIFWLLNGWFQGMGFPPCARSLTHWFSANERGVSFAIWNTSHSIGAALALGLSSLLIYYFNNWRLCFFVPAGLALAGVIFIINRLRDTPESLGLPAVEKFSGERQAVSARDGEWDEKDFKQFVMRNVFGNVTIWVISVANFFLYTVRYGILDWAPTFLTEMKGMPLHVSGGIAAFYEIMGVVGMLVGGWMTDKLFKGRGSRVCFIYMLVCSICIFLFWSLPYKSVLFNVLLLGAIGFFIYGPQLLVGVIAANLATKRAAATAIGLTGFFGYLSTVLSGWGLGAIVVKGGWNLGFAVMTLAAITATVLFASVWNANHRVRKEKQQSRLKAFVK